MRRIVYFHRILVDNEEVGYIQLVRGEKGHHEIEYEVDEPFRNKGLISKELPLYLDFLADNGIHKISAIVKVENEISKRILEKNGFVHTGGSEDKKYDYFIYCDLYDQDLLKSVALEFRKER